MLRKVYCEKYFVHYIECMNKTLLIGIAFLLTGCVGSTQVQHAADPQLGAFTSYALLDQNLGRVQDLAPEIEASIHSALEKKGYLERGIMEADLLISYKVLVSKSDTQSPELQPAGGMAQGMGGDMAPDDQLSNNPTDSEARKVLLVLLQDPKTFKVVWLGWSQADVNESVLNGKIKDSIKAIMERVPNRAITPQKAKRAAL